MTTQKGEREEALKVCPFCGGDAGLRHHRLGQRWQWCVVCTSSDTVCYVGPESQWFDTEAEAIDAWNRRPLLSSSKAEGEMRERVAKLEATLSTMVEEFEDATYDMNDGSQSPYRRGLCADARAALTPKESGK